MDLNAILRRIREACEATFGDRLTGVYVHGSIAFGCFQPAVSDVDFLVALDRAPIQRQKEAFVRALLALESDCPAKGLETSVVLAECCRRVVHPVRYELHYSAAHRRAARADLSRFCREMNGFDPDLAAHFAVTRAVGVRLCGEATESLFAPVPWADCMDSILRDVDGAQADVADNPMYVILNLCRALAYAREGRVLSKAQGGQWAIERLPEFAPVIRPALDGYSRGRGLDFTGDDMRAFARSMLEMIHRAAEAGPPRD